MKYEGTVEQIVRKFCRLEYLGYGLYMQISKSCPAGSSARKQIEEVAKDEYRHGVMFGNFLKNKYSVSTMPKFWISLGRTIGCLMTCIPTKSKIKRFSKLEEEACKDLAKALESERWVEMHKLLKAIQPDELRHAQLYDSIYGAG